MPTQASKAQNAQNLTFSSCERTLTANVRADTAATQLLSFAWKTSEESPCGRLAFDERLLPASVLYNSDPSIMEIMNEEKMNPRGSAVEGYAGETSCSDGTHMKTNRYIDPSKHVCMVPIASSKGSFFTIFHAWPNRRT